MFFIHTNLISLSRLLLISSVDLCRCARYFFRPFYMHLDRFYLPQSQLFRNFFFRQRARWPWTNLSLFSHGTWWEWDKAKRIAIDARLPDLQWQTTGASWHRFTCCCWNTWSCAGWWWARRAKPFVRCVYFKVTTARQCWGTFESTYFLLEFPKVATAAQICSQGSPRLLATHSAQMHTLLGLYAMSMNCLDAAEAQLNCALRVSITSYLATDLVFP